MKIEVGKFYMTREGKKVGPVEVNDMPRPRGQERPWLVRDDTGVPYSTTTEGYVFGPQGPGPYDLVAEWTEERNLPEPLQVPSPYLPASADHGPLITRAEAAKVFGRSTTWIDNRITQYSLDAVKLDNGRVMVTTASVAELSKRLAEREQSGREAIQAAAAEPPVFADCFVPETIAAPAFNEDFIEAILGVQEFEILEVPRDMSTAECQRHVDEARRRKAVAATDQQKSEPGRKNDAAKPQFDLIAPEMLFGLSEILTFGAAKYGARNWEAGMSWGRCFGALMRHMWAWWAGEKVDAETGKSHLWHAACCLMFLIAYEARNTGKDDRPNISAAESNSGVDVVSE